jgi:hypothetical protein
MKSLLTVVFFTFLYAQISAQCNIQTNQRDDGVTVRYLRPDRVGFSDRLFLALSMQTNGEDFFVSTISVFEKDAIKLKGNLTLKFANNKSSTLKHFRSEITTFNGYPATLSIFLADKNDLINISNSNITIAMIQLADDVYQAVIIKMNADILIKQYNCLK